MFRSGVSRSLLRSLNNTAAPTFRATRSPIQQELRSQLCTVSRRPQVLSAARPFAPKTVALARWQSRGPVDHIDAKREKEIAQHTDLKADPEHVTSTSSAVAAPIAMKSGDSEEVDPDMMAGIRSDLQTIRETFSLADVPRQAYYMGMAGVLPYAATAMTSVYCAFEIGQSADSGSGFLMSHETAESILHIVEPLQVGYGAVILSFLGAIHWGLEFAKYGGAQGYPRYAIGVISTAVAWPTLLFPVEYALITQFLAFNFLYYTDARAKTRGWAPHWYGVYRFVLTFIVGASIVVSLIARGRIGDRIDKPPGVADRIRAFQSSGEAQIAEEEEARRRFLAEDDADEDEEEEDDEE